MRTEKSFFKWNGANCFQKVSQGTVFEKADKYETVVPSLSILAEPSVAGVDKVVDARGTRKVAEAYLNYLYSEEGQDIIGRIFSGRISRRPRPSTAPIFQSSNW